MNAYEKYYLKAIISKILKDIKLKKEKLKN
jgi:hypothetical protein